MSKLVRKRVITAKVESTYNTDPTPAATDAILVEDLNWSLEGLRMIERPAIRSSLGELQQVYGGSLMSVTFNAEVKNSGSAGTPPELGVLYLGCAMSETIVASTSVTYAPASASQSSITIYIYEDGTLIKMTGCRGNVSFTLGTGNKIMASFTFTGHFTGPADVSLVTPTYDSTVPVALIGGSFTVGSYGAIIQALNFDMGLTIETPPNFNATDGYSEVLVTGRDVNGSIDPEQTLVATKDFMGIFKAGTTMALDTGVIGSTAGNKVQITMPGIYYRNISPGERQGAQVYDLPFGASETTTDNEVSIAFT